MNVLIGFGFGNISEWSVEWVVYREICCYCNENRNKFSLYFIECVYGFVKVW